MFASDIRFRRSPSMFVSDVCLRRLPSTFASNVHLQQMGRNSVCPSAHPFVRPLRIRDPTHRTSPPLTCPWALLVGLLSSPSDRPSGPSRRPSQALWQSLKPFYRPSAPSDRPSFPSSWPSGPWDGCRMDGLLDGNTEFLPILPNWLSLKC